MFLIVSVRVSSFLLKPAVCLLLGASAVLSSSEAKAAMIINVYESGTDTVFSYSGNINLSAVSGTFGPDKGSGALSPRIVPAFSSCGTSGVCSAFISFGTSGNLLRNAKVTYSPSSPSVAFGTVVDYVSVFSSTGQAFGFSKTYIYVPTGYQSLDSIVGAATASNRNLASFGISQGSTTTYTITNGSVSDTITVSASAVPAPLPILGLPAVLIYSRKLKKRIKASREASIR